MDNPFSLVLTLTLAAVIIVVAIGILSRLFPAPSPPAPFASQKRGGAAEGQSREMEDDEGGSLSC